MIDDTLGPGKGGLDQAASPSQTILSASIADILKAPNVRDHANRWAEDLSFLTFDDGIDTEAVDNAPLPGGMRILGCCQICESGEDILPGHHCDDHVGGRDKVFGKEDSNQEAVDSQELDDSCPHVRARSCHNCCHIPLFPNSKDVTQFRVRRLNYSNTVSRQCDHYAAVSYCWSSEQRTQDETLYQVTEENGVVRRARAPNSVLRRAVAFARENGLRLIWIDQECIAQDKPAEKELAIQAMDHVYLRAVISIGLFNTVLEPRHWKSLVAMADPWLRHNYPNRRGKVNGIKGRGVRPQDLIDAMTLITSDRWNTRAWILQEALASSGNMVLLFPRHPSYDVDGSMLFCHEKSQTDLVIHFEALHIFLQMQASSLQGLLSTVPGTEDVALPIQSSPTQDRISRSTLQRVISSIASFHPIQPPKQVMKIWVNRLKQRRTCSAATALRYLQTRQLERTADKLAIVANMCNYPLRLDSTRLGKEDIGLGVCLLALSMLNGDFSLLIPELYPSLQGRPPVFPSIGDAEFSWLHSYTKSLHCIQPPSYKAGSMTTRPNMPNADLTPNGMSMLGTMWEVNEFLDMSSLQVKYADSWLSLRGANNRHQLSPETIRRATTHMLFEIIRHLKLIQQDQIANSILNSTSNYWWKCKDRGLNHSPIESVDQLRTDLRIEGRRDMFELDESPDGFYHQCWVIDRVMKKGGLWIASPTHPPGSYTSDSSPRGASTEDLSYLQNRPYASSIISMKMMEMLTEHTLTMREDSTLSLDPVEYHMTTLPINVSSVTTMLAVPELDMFSRKAIFDVDVTDDQSPIVFTPHQPALDSLPRPALRSLSVWWVVVPYGIRLDHGEEESKTFRVKGMVKGMRRFTAQYADRYHFV